MVIMRQKSHYPRVEYGLLGFADVMNEKRIARFWSKVDRAGEGLCHPWRGSRNAQGYGLFQGAVAYAGYSFLAHRLAFWLANGRDPVGIVRHTCDNPCCCNPSHLVEGTHKDNTADMIQRGRRVIARGARGPQKPTLAAEAWRLRYAERWLITAIARHLGVHRSTVIRWTTA